MPSNIPWDEFRADTIRSMARDLGASKLNTRTDCLAFLRQVEDGGLESALSAYSEAQSAAPKRKAERPAKEIETEPERRSKRVRKSVGGVSPIKSKRQSRAEERSTKKFDGVELPSPKRRASRRSSMAARESSAQADDEETEGGLENQDSKGYEQSSELRAGNAANRLKYAALGDSEVTSPMPSGSDADKENRQIEPDGDADAEGEDEPVEA
ncbi:hypothetical protein HWV62_39132 [Athelia sp. TMB]|nr:hypothetical protein HWV62_39132 [Athelia sp. TMB]